MKKKIDPIVQGATLSSLLTVAACREWGCGFHFVFPLLLRFFLTPSLSYNYINMLNGCFFICHFIFKLTFNLIFKDSQSNLLNPSDALS